MALSKQSHTKQSMVCICFTNNLFIIAKCTYATPDPVQPECSSSVYTVFILFILLMPCSISPTNTIFQSYLYFCQVTVNVLPCKVLLPLLSYQLWLSDAWAKSCQCKQFYLMCNWMCNVNFYSCMLGEPETLLLLNLPTTTAACSCVCMSLEVTYYL